MVTFTEWMSISEDLKESENCSSSEGTVSLGEQRIHSRVAMYHYRSTL